MTNLRMSLSSFRLKRLYKIILSIHIIFCIIFTNLSIHNFTYVMAQIYDYDDEIELEYGVPTLLSEVSVPPGNIFGGQIIGSLYLKANFSNNNGSIWINDQNNDTIWRDYFNKTIERYIDVNSSSILRYSLWANSSTLGNCTVYFTFSARIIHADNFGLGILIVFTPIIIIGIIIYAVTYGRKKEPHSVRVATRIVDRMKLKYEAKHQERIAKKETIFCPKCGSKIQYYSDNFCRACGFKLRG